jgi:hypothetical protein
MTPEEVASKWKKGTKIKWSSPNGVLDDMVMGHDGIYIKIKSGGTIPYQSIVENATINEAKTLDRDDMMTYLEDKYGFRARTTEEFDNSTGGIWVSGEDGQSIGGKRIYSYYSEGKAYEFGVLVRYEKAINKLGWYSEWYDAGTVMIWPL